MNLSLGPVAYQFVSAIAEGRAREVACFGTRGEGKTISALFAMVLHGAEHARQHFPTPVRWIGVTDTFQSHKLKTVVSLQDPLWGGAWRLFDDNHLAVFFSGSSPLVSLELFGIEDRGALDRLKLETVGMWFDEPAPSSVMVQSTGISESAWLLGITSQRIPSPSHPAFFTTNYPDKNHWTWSRFSPGSGVSGFHAEHPERMWFRIPRGDNPHLEERVRRETRIALADRPDLLRRLDQGEPGVVQMGPQVAVGFQKQLHVAKERIFPIKGEPLVIGQDFGHTPTTIIGQPWRGYIRVYASLTVERGGVKQLLEQSVMPWMKMRAPWALAGNMIVGRWDPAAADEETDIERNPVDLLEKYLPGYWQAGPSSWEVRKNLLLPVFNQHAGPGILTLVIDPVDADGLVTALDGGWYYPQTAAGELRSDLPKKPNHPHEDCGDGFCYFLDGVTEAAAPARGPVKVDSAFDPRATPGEVRVESDFPV